MLRVRTKKIVRCVIAVCLSALLLEVLLRVFFSIKVGAVVLLYGIVDSPHDALFDPKGVMLRWDQKHANTAIHDNVFENYSKYFPNQKRIHPDEFGNTIEATINSSGFRGNDFERKKQPGVVRVVTLGASSTFGFKTRDDQTYPHYLQEALNKSASAPRPTNSVATLRGSNITYEVINLGIPHLQSDQICSLFLAEALPLEPDIVTFYEGYTDASSGKRDDASLQRMKRIPFVTTVFRELRHRFLSVALVANKLFGRRYAAGNATVTGFQGEAETKRAQFIRNLDAINRECQSRGIQFIVANQQAASLCMNREEIRGVAYAEEAALLSNKLATNGGVFALEKYFLIHHELMSAEKHWAKTNGVAFVDVVGAMDRDRQCLIDWMHLNATGNQIVASAFCAAITTPQRE